MAALLDTRHGYKPLRRSLRGVRASDRAWIGLGLGVALWDFLCPKGETLSEGMDRYNERVPWATYSVTGLLVAHLLGWLPDKYDLFHVFTHLRHR